MAAADEIDVREPPPLPTKKAVRKMVANKKLSRSYRNLFLKADVDSSGSLGKDEVYALLTAHGIAVSDKYLRGIFDIFDTDASGAISEQEFQCAATPTEFAADTPRMILTFGFSCFGGMTWTDASGSCCTCAQSRAR